MLCFQASYFESLCVNVILEVGFGQGPLVRNHFANVVEGQPYMIIGKSGL